MIHRVLFVDDDPIALMLAKMVQAKNAFAQESLTASNGKKALEYFEDVKNITQNQSFFKEPFLIMLDLNMPVMDGWEFLEEFTNNHISNFPNVTIILLSSSVDPEDIAKSKNYSVVLDFYAKPFTKEMAAEIKERILK